MKPLRFVLASLFAQSDKNHMQISITPESRHVTIYTPWRYELCQTAVCIFSLYCVSNKGDNRQ